MIVALVTEAFSSAALTYAIGGVWSGSPAIFGLVRSIRTLRFEGIVRRHSRS